MSGNAPEISMVIVNHSDMKKEFERVLLKEKFSKEKADICSQVFTDNSLDGVYTHGVNRFSRFIKYIRNGIINVEGEPERTHSAGAIEQWNGNLGPGVLNALAATKRSMELASEYGIGCVALANTNHWMRGGAYGWKAAKKGFVFIGWTNTFGNMPAWGAVDTRLGNNPVVFAAPFGEEAVVLDMAMSQFSYGIMEDAEMKQEKLPFPGGFDSNGKLTDDPSAILETWRTLPMGYWKGAGMALLLDILGTVLSGGIATYEIDKHEFEHGLSQVYISIDTSKLKNHSTINTVVNSIIEDYHNSVRDSGSRKILYPGERVLQRRNENSLNGIPVLKSVWDEILSL